MSVFNPNDHLMQIKNRNGSNDYLPVAWRLVWFREQCPDGSIETDMVLLDLDRETEEEAYQWNNETRRSEKVVKRANGLCIFRATVKDGKGGIASGTKCEKAASFPDFVEKAETGSIGRALAALGYGTQFAPDLEEQHRIVDSPVDRSNTNTGPQNTGKSHASVKPSIHATSSTNEIKQNDTPAPEPALDIIPIYERGKVTGAWTKETFFGVASSMLNGFAVTQENYKRLAQEQLKTLQAAVEQEPLSLLEVGQ